MTNILRLDRSGYHLLFWTVIITLALGFVDEGYYDFRWMKSPGNWVAFGMYGVLIFLSNRFFYNKVFRRLNEAPRIALSIVIGSISSLALIMTIFYVILGFRG